MSSTHCRACYQNSSACSGRGTSGKGDSPPRSEERGTLRLPSFCQRSPHPTPSFPALPPSTSHSPKACCALWRKGSGLEAALARSTAARHNRLLIHRLLHKGNEIVAVLSAKLVRRLVVSNHRTVEHLSVNLLPLFLRDTPCFWRFYPFQTASSSAPLPNR